MLFRSLEFSKPLHVSVSEIYDILKLNFTDFSFPSIKGSMLNKNAKVLYKSIPRQSDNHNYNKNWKGVAITFETLTQITNIFAVIVGLFYFPILIEMLRTFEMF